MPEETKSQTPEKSAMRWMCKLVNILASLGFAFTLSLIGFLIFSGADVTAGHQWLIGEAISLVVLAYGISFTGKVGQKHFETRK